MTSLMKGNRLTGLLACLALLGVAVAGCSSSGQDSPSATSGAAADRRAADTPEAAGRDSVGSDGAVDGLAAFDADAAASTQSLVTPDEIAPKSVISTGNVALRSPDVAEARFEVQKVVDHYRGEISEEQTDTDDEGDVRHSRLVVRIPTADFGEAMKELEESADLISSDTTTDDVTTKVIDIEVRLRVQRRSIARVETLLDRAQSIRDIIAIEGQLSRRQAVLGSLERRQAYLADQTTMSTITVSLERTKEKEVVAEKKEKDTTGFVPGLKAGWDGLTTLAVGVATVIGALLPFAIVLLVLLVPGWPLARRLRRRRTPLGPGPVEA